MKPMNVQLKKTSKICLLSKIKQIGLIKLINEQTFILKVFKKNSSLIYIVPIHNFKKKNKNQYVV